MHANVFQIVVDDEAGRAYWAYMHTVIMLKSYGTHMQNGGRGFICIRLPYALWECFYSVYCYHNHVKITDKQCADAYCDYCYYFIEMWLKTKQMGKLTR